MWQQIAENLRPGQILLTPGRGMPATNQRPFLVTEVSTTYIRIEIGASRTPNRLPEEVFEAVERFFVENPNGYLRIAAEHQTVPTAKSVDEVVRSAVHFPRAIGNYVAAILEAVGCVQYEMMSGRKVIRRR